MKILLVILVIICGYVVDTNAEPMDGMQKSTDDSFEQWCKSSDRNVYKNGDCYISLGHDRNGRWGCDRCKREFYGESVVDLQEFKSFTQKELIKFGMNGKDRAWLKEACYYTSSPNKRCPLVKTKGFQPRKLAQTTECRGRGVNTICKVIEECKNGVKCSDSCRDYYTNGYRYECYQDFCDSNVTELESDESLRNFSPETDYFNVTVTFLGTGEKLEYDNIQPIKKELVTIFDYTILFKQQKRLKKLRITGSVDSSEEQTIQSQVPSFEFNVAGAFDETITFPSESSVCQESLSFGIAGIQPFDLEILSIEFEEYHVPEP